MVKYQFLSLLTICQTTRVELCSPLLSFSGSFHSQTRCTSLVISVTNEISLSFRVRLKSKSVSEGCIRSKHSTNHMFRCISHSKAIGSRISHSLTRWNSPQCKQLMWKEGFQWTRNMSQWITWTRTIRSPKRFIQKDRFVHKRNIISQVLSVAALHVWCIHSVTHLSRRNKATSASNHRPSTSWVLSSAGKLIRYLHGTYSFLIVPQTFFLFGFYPPSLFLSLCSAVHWALSPPYHE